MARSRLLFLGTWALSLLLAAGLPVPARAGEALPEGVQALELAPERDFAQALGAVLRAEIRVLTDPDLALEAAMLPRAGDVLNEWLEVRDLRWSEAMETGGKRFRIFLGYQVFKGIRGNELLTVPPVSLRFRRNGIDVGLEVPAWTFNLVPLIPPDRPDEKVPIREESPPQALSLEGVRNGVAAWSLALLPLLLWGLWMKGLPPFGSRDLAPFVQAARQVRGLRRLPADSDRERAALQLVHTALNASMGRVVFAADLEAVLLEFPRLAELRPELERFFRRSRAVFFESGNAEAPERIELGGLETLCQRCHRLSRASS